MDTHDDQQDFDFSGMPLGAKKNPLGGYSDADGDGDHDFNDDDYDINDELTSDELDSYGNEAAEEEY